MKKLIMDLEEREILALAIALEEEDSRIYRDFAEKLKENNPATASILQSMYEEEVAHRARLMEFYQQRHGDHLPFLRRQDVHGFVKRRPMWLNQSLQPRRVLSRALAMEAETRRFYQEASRKVASADARQLLIDLAEAEEDHQDVLVANVKEQKKSGALSREGFSG
jgi:rubrerythrin